MTGNGPALTRRRDEVRADVPRGPHLIDVGEPLVVEVEITNLDSVIRSFRVGALGLDPDCVQALPAVVDLFPDERSTVALFVTLPADHPAGERTIGVEVADPGEDAPAPAVAEFVVDVRGIPGVAMTTEPSTLEMGSAGTFITHVINTGNTTLEVDLVAQDPERLVSVTFEPERPVIGPGEQAVVRGAVEGPRPWFGMPAVRLLEVQVAASEQTATSMVAIVQRPRFGRRLIAFLGLLLVVTLFAYLIQRSFARVAELSAQNEALVKQGLGFDDDELARTVPAGVSGAVTSSTGAGIDGAAVQLYQRDNPLRASQSTVTDATGAYRFSGVADGSYLVRTEAAGFGVVWYPAGATFEEGETIEVADGQPVAAIDIVLAGRPGLVGGTVLGADVEGALVVVQLPADVIGGSDIEGVASVVQSAVVDATGQFVLADLATPATYQVVVSKLGFASATRTVSLTAGEQRDDIDILLTRGVGRISGSVLDTAGDPVGGVVIDATDGTSDASTRSLSGDVDSGTFELRGLTTPATYTLTFTAPGFFDETLTLALEEEQQRDDVVVIMSRDRGSLAGSARSLEGRSLGGITVSVVGGDVALTTQTLSVGEIGRWFVGAIPVPGTYTVTFEGEGFTTTALSVDLGSGAEAIRDGLDAVLTPATSSVRGTVTDTSGQAISGVTVSLESPDVQRHTISSDEPLGAYVFDAIPPGVYTVTYRRAGSTPHTLLVDLAAGEQLELDPVQLEQQARIVGVVTRNGIGVADIGIVVYRLSTYPSEVVTSTTSGAGGRFEVIGLEAPETYIVEFQVPAGGPVVGSRVVFLRPDEVVQLEVDL